MKEDRIYLLHNQRTEISGLTLLRWFVRVPCWREAAVGIRDWSGWQPSTPSSLDPYSIELAGPCPGIDHGGHSGSAECRGR